ncbi:hypothetical protein E2C01_015069 [Portunus trituberculatus]|uniref:Uncharacterized protein n=1 Tax=Portunus trituberculatus TaxID=210409 RepID=A0A5B7DLU3_PORTR|nr:hypothetical protein [Portunus trituberculatus]
MGDCAGGDGGNANDADSKRTPRLVLQGTLPLPVTGTGRAGVSDAWSWQGFSSRPSTSLTAHRIVLRETLDTSIHSHTKLSVSSSPWLPIALNPSIESLCRTSNGSLLRSS